MNPPLPLGPTLDVEFCGERHCATPDRPFTLGRSGDLVVDDANRYLHRLQARFTHRGGRWWIENLGRSTPLAVVDAGSGRQSLLAPGADAPVGPGGFVVRFQAGPTTYEVAGSWDAPEAVRPPPPSLPDEAAEPTDRWGVVDLNDEQRLLLAALAEHRLRHPADILHPLPTNRQVALRLGWSITKFNRKLDHLCEKLSRAGVVGLRGDLGGLATDRRRNLVAHVTDTEMIGPDDLALLP